MACVFFCYYYFYHSFFRYFFSFLPPFQHNIPLDLITGDYTVALTDSNLHSSSAPGNVVSSSFRTTRYVFTYIYIFFPLEYGTSSARERHHNNIDITVECLGCSSEADYKLRKKNPFKYVRKSPIVFLYGGYFFFGLTVL